MSLPYLEDLQKTSTETSLQIFYYYTLLGDYPCFIAIIGVIMIFEPSKIQSMNGVTYLCTTLWLMNSMKMLYHEKRPYFDNEIIVPYGSCSVEYGNPSGHSMFSCGLSMFLYLNFVYSNSKRDFYIKLLKRIANEKFTQDEIKMCVIFSTVLVIFAVISQVWIYLYIEDRYPYDQAWIDLVIKKCPNISRTSPIFNDVSLLNSFVCIINYTAFLGLLYKRHLFGLITEQIYFTSIIKTAHRILLYIIASSPALILNYLLKFDSFILTLLVRFTISLYAGFGLFFIAFYLQYKLRVLNTEAHQKYQELSQPLMDDKFGNQLVDF
ncbi:pap2 superfamily phosphatase [Stylonychia lemnae]|uniref:Pap2 superfamily phosphatase n=1 Tax=Stylonychia lemnae TaxID=5949 RepID=A0A078ACN4_STYLE|nr:pap2 superfamily phosphatase [Stylonychia lemnae]|eukprot:CDW80015.1 pap2 superfamily phosphatase [Stylonychia lemnae]